MDRRDALNWLMDWYAEQSNGEWEHDFGVSIETIDNPGWHLKIDLEGTELEGRAFAEVFHNVQADHGWWILQVEENEFRASCGPRDLPEVIAAFRSFAES
jgi:hypothetical protein